MKYMLEAKRVPYNRYPYVFKKARFITDFIQNLPITYEKNKWEAFEKTINMNQRLDVYFYKAGKKHIYDVIEGFGFIKGFLISAKVKNIFENLYLPFHVFFKVNLILPEERLEYYFLYLPASEAIEKINFSKSSFYQYNSSIDKDYWNINKTFECRGPIQVKSIKELYATDGQISLFKQVFEKTAIPVSNDYSGKLVIYRNSKEYDIYNLGANNFMITEKLKNLLIENEITGFDITDAPWIKEG